MGAPPRTGWRYDPTVNLGHILTMGSMLVALSGGWMAITARQEFSDSRLERIEQQMGIMTQLMERSTRSDAIMESVRADLAETRRRIERLERGGKGE